MGKLIYEAKRLRSQRKGEFYLIDIFWESVRLRMLEGCGAGAAKIEDWQLARASEIPQVAAKWNPAVCLNLGLGLNVLIGHATKCKIKTLT